MEPGVMAQPVIPFTQETEVQQSQTQGQPGQFSKFLSQNEKRARDVTQWSSSPGFNLPYTHKKMEMQNFLWA